ncbi:MAG: single-stranded-DNA-specific exonuclease RecJ [Spirochaetota bacterium]
MADHIDELINNSPEWVFKELDEREVGEFAEVTGLDRRISRLLLLRDVRTEQQLHHYLHDDIFALHNPFSFTRMQEAVTRTRQAVRKGERIFIFGDRDVDGVLSTAMLYNLLRRFEGDVRYRVPEGEYGYGLEMKDVEHAGEEGVSLIITVDTGVSSNRELEYAATLGMDAIVMDHHIPPQDYPRQAIILNPKMDFESYPFRDLSAGGVVLKFIHAFVLSHTKNYNRVFVPLVAEGQRIRGAKVKNGLVTEQVEFSESIHYPFGENEVVVSDAQRQLPAYFTGWMKERNLTRLNIITSKPYHTLGEFVDIFLSLFARKQKKTTAFVRSFMDLAAVSTLSDIMPLEGENRVIVREGLAQVPRTENLGLHVLLEYCNLPPAPYTARDITWHLSPVINSAGRMGNAASAVKLFTTDSAAEANELSRLLIEYNERRKEKGERNLNIIRPIIEDRYYKDPIIVLSTNKAEHGVTGIIASRIAKKFSKPAIIIVDNGIIGVGSGRGNGNYDLVELVSRCEDLLVKYGGHRSAVGFTIETGNIDQFSDRIRELVEREVDLYSVRDLLEIDDVLRPEEVTTGLYRELGLFEPTGRGNPPPRFAVLDTTVTDPVCIGRNKSHIKFFIPGGEGMVPVLGWGLADKTLRILEEHRLVDLAFTIEENYFRQERSLQLVLMDIRGAAERRGCG